MRSDEEYLLLLEKTIETLSQRPSSNLVSWKKTERRLFGNCSRRKASAETCWRSTCWRNWTMWILNFFTSWIKRVERRYEEQRSKCRRNASELKSFRPCRRWKWRGNATRFWRTRKNLMGMCCPLNNTSVVSLRERTISLYSNGRERWSGADGTGQQPPMQQKQEI